MKKVWQLIFFVMVFLLPFSVLGASKVDELKNLIKEQNEKLQQIEAEIAESQKQLNEVGAEKQTLQSTIDRLNISRRKFESDIRLTQSRINSTNLNLQKLSIEIGDKEEQISQRQSALGETVRLVYEADNISLVETFLKYDKIGEFWDEIETVRQFQDAMRGNLIELRDLRQDLEENKNEEESRKKNLIVLNDDLKDQKIIVDLQKREKDVLLSQTKNKESNYKKLLDEKIAQREEFEKALSDYESQLRIEIDPTSLPPVGKGVLAWPLASIFITQEFGNTAFAKANSYVYNGKGHNGVDFRAPTGTKVKASLSGVVEGIGNTDLQRGCYSYGKWVLIKHNNGLSTLYAHLSVIKVDKGDVVETGDTIGLSGNTGYSTGPHLHFTVYASLGVKIVRLGDVKARTNCGNVRIPVAPFNAYLNPIVYL